MLAAGSQEGHTKTASLILKDKEGNAPFLLLRILCLEEKTETDRYLSVLRELRTRDRV